VNAAAEGNSLLAAPQYGADCFASVLTLRGCAPWGFGVKERLTVGIDYLPHGTINHLP
jgi:hypothetical protein